jgi:adenosine deaminase
MRAVIDPRLAELIREIPKAEQHVHIDSIWPEFLMRLAERNRVEPPFDDIEGAEQAYWTRYDTLEEFLDFWVFTMQVLQTEEDYADLLIEAARDAQEQNIIYREGMFTYAGAHESRGIPLEVVMSGFSAGLAEVNKSYDVDLQLIAEIDRTIDPSRAVEFVEVLEKYRDQVPIIAIGLDMQEEGYPGSRFVEAFQLANEHGYYTTAHCGETGPEDIWITLESLPLDRLDHGVLCVEDDALVQEILDRGIPMTVCPQSNVVIAQFPTMESHPTHEMMKRGLNISINSDDPPFLHGSNLIDNYLEIARAFELTTAEIVGLVRNGFASSFKGAKYLERVDAWLEAQDLS